MPFGGIGIGIPLQHRGGGGASGASKLLDLYGITHGIALNFEDDSAELRDIVTPANNYKAKATEKIPLRTNGAMRWNANRVLEWTPENQLRNPNDFTTGNWVKDTSGALVPVVTANVGLAPDGTMTASRIVFDKTGGVFSRIAQNPHAGNVNVGHRMTGAIWIKRNAAFPMNITLRCGDGVINNGAAAFDVTDEWKQISTSHLINAASVDFQLLVWDSAPTNTETADVLVWHAQYDRSSYVRPYKEAGGNAYYSPRIDYAPHNGFRPGLLVEPQITNSALYCNDHTNGIWSKTNCTVTADTDIAPDGSMTMDRLVASAGGTSGIAQTFTGTAAPYTYSCFAKKKAGNGWLRLVLTSNASPTTTQVWFNLNTGQIGTVLAGITRAEIVDCGGGIYRCGITTTCFAVTETIYARLARADNDGTADAGDDIAVWGEQLENSPYMTSFYPSLAGTANTRLFDPNTLSAGAHPISTVAQSFYSKFRAPATADVFGLAFGVNTYGLRKAGNNGSVYIRIGGTGDVAMPGTAIDGVNRLAGRLKSGDNAGVMNGALNTGGYATDLSGMATYPLYIGSLGVGVYMYGHVYEVLSAGQELSNAQLQAIAA